MRAWESYIRRVTPYTPGEQPDYKDMIKLNTNECPYPPAPKVAEVINNLDSDLLRLYPNPNAQILVDEIASYHKVNPKQVFVGVGSDDVLGMAFLTFFCSDKPIIFPDITYSFYEVWADLFRIPYKLIPLNESFEIMVADYSTDNGGVIFANPNAPTAIELSIDKVESIIKNNQESIVIVDEAYIDFGGNSALGLVDKYENVLVVRTFSKSRAMAGMRIGYAIGNEKLIQALLEVKFSYNSYTMNQPSLIAGVEAMRDEDYFRGTLSKIIKTRDKAVDKLAELGFSCTDSKTNFLFAKHHTVPAKEIYEYLRDKHIFVRYFNKDRIDDYLRITIGTDEEMNRLYLALEEFLG